MMTRRETSSTRCGPEKGRNGNLRQHDRAMTALDAASRKPRSHARNAPQELILNDPSGLLGNGTFLDDPEEVSPRGGNRGLGVDYGQDKQKRLPEVDSLAPAPLKVSPRTSPSPRAQSRNGRPNDIAPWMNEGPELNTHGLTSATLFGDGSSKPQKSPSLRPGTARTGHSVSPDPVFAGAGEERNPSITSATTLGSQNSWSTASRRQTGPSKQIAPFLGDEEHVSSKSSEASLPNMLQREQTNSSQHSYADSGMHSPTSSRPRTPPSSDVVPWLFQDFKDVTNFGDAPIRKAPSGVDKKRYADDSHPPQHSNHHKHRVHLPGHLPGHRHTRSREEVPRPPPKESVDGFPPRPLTGARQDSTQNIRMLKDNISSPMSSRNTLPVRRPSPTPSSTPSQSSGLSRAETAPGQRSPGEAATTGKRSLLDKLRRHPKGDKHSLESLNNFSGSTFSLQSPNSRDFRSHLTDPNQAARQGSVATFNSGSTAKASEHMSGDSESPISKKESAGSKLLHSHAKFPKPKRGFSNYDKEAAKEAERTRNASIGAGALFSLDTNLDDMEGIVDPNASMSMALHGGIFTGEPIAEESYHDPEALNGPGAWYAPDSWVVKKVGDVNLGRLPEIDEAGIPQKIEDDGTPYCVRIFRIDSTFATLSMGVNTTASEVLQVLGKKSFLQDDLDNYQIIMRKHDLHRQLSPGERPIAIQKKLLEQAGYQNTDRIEEIGREDNSYLCRFTFVPTKLSGYYSLETEQGHGKLQKFSHIDLQGRSLVTIPITLYQKAVEIQSLNLSRNLALDVPKDFIQSCINLREIRYISNEAWQLPASLSLAMRLTVLDISNNRLEQLEHAELDKLPNLISIKMSNNKLRHLPKYFGQYKALRSLNISSNYIDVFPDFLCDLRSLVDLDLSFNTVRSLPKIGQLTTLERLWATNNMLHGSFPDNFQNLRNLKEVDIRFNAITNIDIFAALPNLEQLMAGHNQISKFEGAFEKIRLLNLDHNPMTRFDFKSPVMTLTSLNLASAKIAQLDDSIFERIRNVAKLTLDKNHFSTLSKQVSRLQKLEYLSIAKNPLSSLPSAVGSLHELRYLDIRECNLKQLPAEIWFCHKLSILNVSSNVLESFPKLPTAQPEAQSQSNHGSAESTPIPASTPEFEEISRYGTDRDRRPSQASAGLLSVGASPAPGARQGSIVSVYGPGGRKASVVSRTNGNTGTMTPISRKDSNLQQRFANTLANSLTHLYLADNRLDDTVFDEITMLPELRLVNLSYNELSDIPQRSLRRWLHLSELYLSGNELTSLPSDDLEQVSSLKVLHLNGNKFQVLPAELGKVYKLAVLDVGSNALKYNVSNWPYDWNWNWNRNLKYLNFSGNRRLEIKPSRSFTVNGGREGADLTNFSTLHHLRVLGLMDVTLTIPSVPEENEDRRVRTSGSLAGVMTYGMADSLGKYEHLSIIDLVVPKFRGYETETLLGMFDGQALSSGGSRIARYLHENFEYHLTEELSRLKKDETAADGLRKAFLALNKDLATNASQTLAEKEHRTPSISHRGSTTTGQSLTVDDLSSGGVATVAYLDNMELYIANVGDAQAMLIQSDGAHKILTRKHEPADRQERERIREAGGYVSRHGKLNEALEVSRAFGYIQMMPAVMAAPHVSRCTLKESDEMILIASKELWDYMSLDMVVDVARSERNDLMRAAQKLRDLAMAFGSTDKLMVMMIGVSELKRRNARKYPGQTLSMVQSQMQDETILSVKRAKKPKDRPDDSTLQRLDPEVPAPTGYLSMVFTDIKSSTTLWELYPVAMRSAIKLHNEIMRRQLRVIGGYEVKTEGDAFVVSFPTATSALLWCFVVQQHLLDVDWPPEILDSAHCQEVLDTDDNRIYRGLSVRMGAHWGEPVCEPDPVTRRMDYFGPMVNRSARISGAADGGQIYVSSDFVAEIHRALEMHADDERSMSTGSPDMTDDDTIAVNIRKELRALSTQGFEVKDLGTQKLKGLENPELLYLMYPHSLAGRLIAQQQQKDAAAATASNEPASLSPNSSNDMDIQYVWDLWNVSLRLEMLCSALESPGQAGLRPPEKSVLERMKNRGGEVTDRFLISFLEHQVTRVETCVSTLALRNMVTPFRPDQNLLEQACPMEDILGHISAQLTEFRALKEKKNGPNARPAGSTDGVSQP